MTVQRFRKLTSAQAYQKLVHYCAYQERCHLEVKQKAYSLGLKKTEVEELTSKLIEKDLLNEMRFAAGYAGGKFRMKKWGRIKIIRGLKQRQVSDYCIRKALEEIPDDEYRKTAYKLAKTKWVSVKGAGTNHFIKMSKTKNYMLQKGYEPRTINELIHELAG